MDTLSHALYGMRYMEKDYLDIKNTDGIHSSLVLYQTYFLLVFTLFI